MPKYLIIIVVIVVIFIINAIRMAMRSSNHHFKCSACGENFQVSFFKYMFTAHSFDGKCRVTCPKCGKTNMLQSLDGKK
ncbi:MAG: hypothetical protein FWC47_06090 [Oscillospiraceae bacterium]|nr:hypothetical protein [Oscillospiraceae bacterium]